MVAGIIQVRDFLQVIGLGRHGGLEVLCVDQASFWPLDPFPGALVERIVIDRTGIGNLATLSSQPVSGRAPELRGRRSGCGRRSGRRGGFLFPARDEDEGDDENHQPYITELFSYGYSLPKMISDMKKSIAHHP